MLAEDVGLHGQALDQEQLLMGEEKGLLLRERLPMRRHSANPLIIISNLLLVRIPTTTSHRGIRLPLLRRSTVMQAGRRIHQARVGATQP